MHGSNAKQPKLQKDMKGSSVSPFLVFKLMSEDYSVHETPMATCLALSHLRLQPHIKTGHTLYGSCTQSQHYVVISYSSAIIALVTEYF